MEHRSVSVPLHSAHSNRQATKARAADRLLDNSKRQTSEQASPHCLSPDSLPPSCPSLQTTPVPRQTRAPPTDRVPGNGLDPRRASTRRICSPCANTGPGSTYKTRQFHKPPSTLLAPCRCWGLTTSPAGRCLGGRGQQATDRGGVGGRDGVGRGVSVIAVLLMLYLMLCAFAFAFTVHRRRSGKPGPSTCFQFQLRLLDEVIDDAVSLFPFAVHRHRSGKPGPSTCFQLRVLVG
jgi:hypothetical protein